MHSLRLWYVVVSASGARVGDAGHELLEGFGEDFNQKNADGGQTDTHKAGSQLDLAPYGDSDVVPTRIDRDLEGAERRQPHQCCDAAKGTDDEHESDGDLAVAFHLQVADEHERQN